MAKLTLETISTVTGGTLSDASTIEPTGYSIDSRTIKPGDLFFAITGPNHDGHRFASEAVSRGACGLVISDREPIDAMTWPGSRLPEIVVPDTLKALQDLAAHVRHLQSTQVIGITGSGGKTTTKEMTREVLRAKFSVHASRGNYNNLYGCPLSILELEPQHQVSVLELGMSYHGELKRLAEIADPDIGILTNVSGVHLAHFESIEDVGSAKAELFEGMRENSIGIFNNDDEQCRRIMTEFKGYAFTFGIERPSDLTASDYRMVDLDGSVFSVSHAHNGSGRTIEVRTKFLGLHKVYNALAAISAGYMLGIDLEATAARFANLEPTGMRGKVLRLKGQVHVYDDCYNANPAAMKHMFRVLNDAQPVVEGGRKVVVIGDMLELGPDEVEAHRELGRILDTAGVSIVIGVGALSREAIAQITNREAHHFDDADAAADYLCSHVLDGDLVMVKGSRGIALDKVVAALREGRGEE